MAVSPLSPATSAGSSSPVTPREVSASPHAMQRLAKVGSKTEGASLKAAATTAFHHYKPTSRPDETLMASRLKVLEVATEAAAARAAAAALRAGIASISNPSGSASAVGSA